VSESPTTPAETETTGTGSPLLVDQIRILWKFRHVIAAVAIVTTAIVALWTLRQPKIYSAHVSIEFDPNPPRPLGREVEGVQEGAQSYWLTREYYVTQYRILESQRVSEGVVRQLGLQHDADFLGVPAAQRSGFRSVSLSRAASALRSRLTVEPVRDSRLVIVRVEDVSPRRAQLLANTIATVYIRQNLEQRMSVTVNALEWLGQQLDSLRGQVETSERALYDYRRSNNLLSVSYEDRRNHLVNRIERLSTALTETQTRRISVAARLSELRRAARAEDPLAIQAPELLASSLLQHLRERYEEARRERDSLGSRYGANAPQMLAVVERVREIADAIRHEIRNTVAAADAELRSTHSTEGGLRAALIDAQREALDLNLREIEYGRLSRERENNVKLYGIVLERTRETGLTRLLRVNNVRILDEAMLPGAPIKPRTAMNIVLGLLFGVFLGVGSAVLLIQADRTIRTQLDIEDKLHQTFLGMIPTVEPRGIAARYRYRYGAVKDEGPIRNRDMVVHSHPTSAVAEACRVIRTNLLFMSPDIPLQTLMVASGHPQEGKTMVAMSLALTMAQSGKKVLLIDSDLRRPRVHKAIGIRPAVGITSVLVNEATLDEAIVETEVPNLYVLPCGPIPPNPSELLHSQRFHEILRTVKERFDRVVLDTPPIGVVTDALVIGPQVDGAVFVVRARKTQRARAAAMLTQLRSLSVRLAGVVLNDVDLRGDGGSQYYYGSAYEYRAREEAA